MDRLKRIWTDALDNARRAPREKWLIVSLIAALMLVVGAFALVGA